MQQTPNLNWRDLGSSLNGTSALPELILPRDTDSCRMSSVSIRHLHLNKTVWQTLTKPSGKILNSNAENRYPSATGIGNFPNTHSLPLHETHYGCLCTVYGNTAWRWQSYLKPHLGSSCSTVLLRKRRCTLHFVTHTGVHKSTLYRAWWRFCQWCLCFGSHALVVDLSQLFWALLSNQWTSRSITVLSVPSEIGFKLSHTPQRQSWRSHSSEDTEEKY